MFLPRIELYELRLSSRGYWGNPTVAVAVIMTMTMIVRLFAQVLFFVVRSKKWHAVLQDILLFRDENLALPECHDGENEEDKPGDDDDNSHDEMNSVETLDIENIPQNTSRSDPTDVRESQRPAYVCL